MARYRVRRNCTWKQRYWDVDKIVDLDPADKPPHHFELLDRPPETEPVDFEDGAGELDNAPAEAADIEKPDKGKAKVKK